MDWSIADMSADMRSMDDDWCESKLTRSKCHCVLFQDKKSAREIRLNLISKTVDYKQWNAGCTCWYKTIAK